MEPLPEAPKSKERPSFILVLVALAAVGSLLFVALPIGLYAFRMHVTRAKVADTRQHMHELAAAIAQCAHRPDSGRAARLPPTALPVPRALASVSGRSYQSTSSDWQDEAYRCARFTIEGLQSGQLQWIRASDREGYVRVAIDVDGDMTPEWILEQPVSCDGERACTLGDAIERR
jgi:hypothetical protein